MSLEQPSSTNPSAGLRRWVRSPLVLTVLGSLLLWLAQPGTLHWFGGPGISFGWLAWLAPAPWVVFIQREEPFTRRQFFQVWLGGWFYWMLALHWVRLPHPLTPIGWPLLCVYFGLYPALFVVLTRTAIRRVPTPAWLVAPTVWVALEFVQAHLFTGIQIGALSHTQVFTPLVIQISDLGGGYAVSFVLMMGAATTAYALHRSVCAFRRAAAVFTTLSVIVATFAYGQMRMTESTEGGGPVVALIQGASLATWDEDWQTKNQHVMDAQVALTQQADELATKEGLAIDLVVWPESMFRAPIVTIEGKLLPPSELPEQAAATASSAGDWFTGLAARHDAALLLGADRFDLTPNADLPSVFDQTIYNSAILVDRAGKITAVYDKTHRVPFGEYIPFAKHLPALYYLTPMSGGLGEGAGPVAMRLSTEAGDISLAPSICYESVLPHVIRRQVAQLTRDGAAPDVLVNVTNDAWFWGSSELDLHLACAVFRAVENRRPMAIAANTGLSAVVDGSGRLLGLGARMRKQPVVRRVPLDGRGSFYSQHGDWFALVCLLVTVVLNGAAFAQKDKAPLASACSVAGTAQADK